MKKETTVLRYLDGKAPLHPERLALPSEEELNETEELFDRMVAERQRQAVIAKKAYIIRLRPWIAAASLLILISIGFWALLPKASQPQPVRQEVVAEAAKPIVSESISPAVPLQPEKPQQAVPTKSNLHKQTAKPATSLQRTRGQAPLCPEIDLAAEVADLVANIDQLEQQILVTETQNNN